MDSVTQILLGAAVGEAALGHRVGRKAAVWGAVCGTLPDLDVFLPYANAVSEFTYHRSATHSLLIMAAVTPLLVWLARRMHPADAHHHAGWYLLVYLVFATHALLDACTIYGTQIFWPVDTTPVTWGTVFIIDPLVTVPLLVGVAAVALLRSRPGLGYRINNSMLLLCAIYIAWSFAARAHIQELARAELARQGMPAEQVLALASPFNTVLWRVVAMTPNGYHVGWYSLLDESSQIEFAGYDSQPSLLSELEDQWPVRRLKWFTKGFYKVWQEENFVVISDLRMGIEDGYVFNFRVGEVGPQSIIPIEPEQFSRRPDFGALGHLWQRVLGNTSAPFPPR